MRKMTATVVGGVAVLGSVLVPTVSANASPVPPVSSADISASAQAAAVAYWTPSRMAAAVDLDAAPVTVAPTAKPSSGEVHPIRVAPAFPASGARAAVEASSPGRWTSGGLISTTGGKVFFHNPATNGDYACSGDSVNSNNKSVVATAGHCVVDTNGTSYTNWVFIPAYDHGNRPFGTFAATSLHWMPQRIGDADATWDAAFATVGQVNGRSLVDTVGGQGIGFDLNPGVDVHSFGYGGSEAEGNGEQMNWCAGTEVFQQGHEGGGVWGIDCVQSGGSSGGPFLRDFDAGNGAGTQTGNISISVGDMEYHPYYGHEAADAYNGAQNA
jgi:V8-like Glu-specific endopeptidase